MCICAVMVENILIRIQLRNKLANITAHATMIGKALSVRTPTKWQNMILMNFRSVEFTFLDKLKMLAYLGNNQLRSSHIY